MNFPKSTQVNKIMPKEAFYRNLDLNPTIKNAFVSDIKRIFWTNKLSHNTLNIEKGENVSEILVLSIELKEKTVNYKIFETISKNNSHKILYELIFENQMQIVLFHNNLYKTKWQNDPFELKITGLNLDKVWENIVKNVELGIRSEELNSWDDNLSLDENLALHEKREKLQKEIARLEKQARAEKQPKKKFQLAQQVKALKKELEENKNE